MLAVDYALKPVLSALRAQEILQGVFADDSQIADYQHKATFSPHLQARLDSALETFTQALHRLDRKAPLISDTQGVVHV
jgi:FMN reductase